MARYLQVAGFLKWKIESEVKKMKTDTGVLQEFEEKWGNNK